MNTILPSVGIELGEVLGSDALLKDRNSFVYLPSNYRILETEQRGIVGALDLETGLVVPMDWEPLGAFHFELAVRDFPRGR